MRKAFLFLLSILIIVLSCKRNSTSIESHERFWKKTSAPDSVSFMNILVTSNGTLIASSGDFPIEAKKDGYIFRSDNSGSSWQEISLGVDAVSSLIEYKAFLLAGTTKGVYMSADDGVSWGKIGLDSIWVKSLDSFSSENINIIVAGTPEGIYKSEDDALSWTQITKMDYDDCIAILSSDVIFAGKIGGMSASLFVSRDGGTSWTTALSGLGVTNISIWNGKVYAGGYRSEEWFGGLYISADEGRTWETIFSDHESVTSTYVSQNKTIYLSGYNTGVRMKKNNESDWTELNQGLSSLWITSLACDSHNYLYATSDLGGIYKSLAVIK